MVCATLIRSRVRHRRNGSFAVPGAATLYRSLIGLDGSPMNFELGPLSLETTATDSGPFVPRVRLQLGATIDGLSGFDVWREQLSSVFEVLPPDDGATADPFRIETTSWHLGDLVASQLAFSAREQARTTRRIRADQLDHYRLLLQTSGELRLELDGRQIVVRPGQMLISDMSRPERFSATAGSNIVLVIPREVLEEALPAPVHLHGLVMQGSAARMLGTLLSALVADANELERSSAAGVSRSAIQLAAAAIAPCAQTLDAARPATEVNLLRQICRYIDLHLTDAELSPTMISTQFRVSRPTLYRLFEPLGGVASYIKEQRLTRIHGVLESASGARMQLARLAEEYAFTDAGHFSRSFRKLFGYSPSEVGLVPSIGALGNVAAVGARKGGLGKWLKAL